MSDVIFRDLRTFLKNFQRQVFFAFENCYNLDGTLNITDSVLTINDYSFFNFKNLKGSLEITNSVIKIGDYSFDMLGFETLKLGFNKLLHHLLF